MSLTCTQMDVLISFYLENELSQKLRCEVEDHLKNCRNCRSKYEMIKKMITDIKNCLKEDEKKKESIEETENIFATPISMQYSLFKNNLSAYIDNELPNNENIKIKKYTINNKKARKDLENSYSLRKLMNESFKKAQNDAKFDYSKNIIKQLELEEEAVMGLHPAIKFLLAFSSGVFIITAIVLFSLSV